MIIEVGINELKADLSRYLQAAQEVYEVLIKGGDRPVARLVPPETDFLEITPPQRHFMSLRNWKELAPLPLLRKRLTKHFSGQGATVLIATTKMSSALRPRNPPVIR